MDSFFSLGVTGATASLVFPFILEENAIERAYKNLGLISMALIGLSFVYGLLGLSYVSLSGRHDRIVECMKESDVNYERYFGQSTGLADFIWPLCHAMIFVLPCFVTMAVATSFFCKDSQLPPELVPVFRVLALAAFGALWLTLWEWSRRRLERRLTKLQSQAQWIDTTRRSTSSSLSIKIQGLKILGRFLLLVIIAVLASMLYTFVPCINEHLRDTALSVTTAAQQLWR